MRHAGGVSHDHAHAHAVTARTDRRWLLAALVVIVLFMAGEVTAGVLAHSLALITDAGHMVTDAAAIGVAVIAARIARRPAQGAYTYGFTRVDTLSGQLNGMTLLLLATWFAVLGVRRLVVGESERPAARIEEIRLADVEVGMSFAADVVAANGLLLVARGQDVTQSLLHRIRSSWSDFATKLRVRVVVTAPAPAPAVVERVA